MPKKGERVAFPISEEFANLLFAGRGVTTEVFEGENSDTEKLLFSTEHNIPLPGPGPYPDIYTFILYLSARIQQEYESKHPVKKHFSAPFSLGLNQIDGVITLQGYPMGVGRLRLQNMAILYGEWDDAGPRLVFQWLHDNPRSGTIDGSKLLIAKLKEYDAVVSGKERNIGSRIRNTEETRQTRKNLIHLSDPGSERRALPESVLKHIANYVGEPESKRNLPSAPLARLLPKNNHKTKRHGGARRKTTRRKH